MNKELCQLNTLCVPKIAGNSGLLHVPFESVGCIAMLGFEVDRCVLYSLGKHNTFFVSAFWL